MSQPRNSNEVINFFYYYLRTLFPHVTTMNQEEKRFALIGVAGCIAKLNRQGTKGGYHPIIKTFENDL